MPPLASITPYNAIPSIPEDQMKFCGCVTRSRSQDQTRSTLQVFFRDRMMSHAIWPATVDMQTVGSHQVKVCLALGSARIDPLLEKSPLVEL